jgi:hypothetical protein
MPVVVSRQKGRRSAKKSMRASRGGGGGGGQSQRLILNAFLWFMGATSSLRWANDVAIAEKCSQR